MTDEAKALVEELRLNDSEIYLPVLGKAADLIEAQAREIERLTLTVIKLQGNQAALEAEIERLKSHLEDAKEIIQKQIKQAAELAKFKALAETQAREIERLREALQSVVNACDQGKLAPLGGPCGMTIEAQIRGSVYNRVPAWPVEEARAALAGDTND